ncbi:phage scaffolding protein [Streptococcus suis]
MTFKEYLISTGLTDEQATKVEQGMPAQKLYLASEENLDTRYTKLKEQKEQLENDLNAANKLVGDLKKTNKDAEELQQKITDYEAKVQQLETERSEERKTYALKEALTKEGALPEYVDLLMPTLKGVELDADGNLNGFEDIFKGIKESKPALFKTEQTQTNPAETNGYKVIDNKLDSGKQGETQPKSLAEAIQLSYENKQ